MKTISYFDALERKTAFFSPTGDGTIAQYELKFDKDGTEILVKTEIRRNLFDEIQAYKESTEISNIIERYTNGELDVLYKSPGEFVDVRDAPTSYADYFAKVREAEKLFYDLPQDVRDKFDDDPEKFYLEFGTSSFTDKVSELDNAEQVIAESEAIDNAE